MKNEYWSPVCMTGSDDLRVRHRPTGIRGQLVDLGSGSPLGGLRVVARLALDEAVEHRRMANQDAEPRVIGDASSNDAGRFTIAVPDDAHGIDALIVLASDPRAAVRLSVESAQGTPYVVAGPIAAPSGVADVTIAVPLSATTPPESTWRELAERLAQASIHHFNEIVRTLPGAQAPGAPFYGWDLELRMGVLASLEAAFTDPTQALREAGPLASFAELHRAGALDAYCHHLGERDPQVWLAFADMAAKVHDFTDLAAVDWAIEPGAFAQGNPEAALRAAQERYRVAHHPSPVLRGGAQ